MTVASTSNRVDYTGNGSTTVFSFSFRIFEAADLVVTKADTNGVETTLVLNTDYTVTGAGSYTGGNVTLSTALTNGHALTIQRVLDITQETDLRNQGQFFAETHEDVFDRMVMIGQQLQEQIDRAAKLPVTNTSDAEELTADIVLLADNITMLDTIADAITDIQTVANDLNEGTSEIEVVAGSISNVNTVGSNITNVNTVAGISSAVSTVASNITDIQNAEENAAAAISAQTAAESARDQVLAVYDSFDDRYLGAKTSDPTLDNDGNALVAGAIYFNSSSGVMRLYTGSAWVAAYVQGVASSIGFTPAGNIAATTVQAAIEELDSEKIATSAIGSTVQAYDVDTAKTDVAQSYSKAQRGAVVALTDASSIATDLSLGNNFSVTLGGNRTLANPTNLTAGQAGIIVITQDGTGSRTLAYGSYWKFPTGTAPTLTTTASAVDVLAYYVESSTRITARLIGDVK